MIMTNVTRAPACFAPPLSDEVLAGYRTLIESVSQPDLRDVLLELLTAVESWWSLPYSDAAGLTTPNGVRLVPLEPEMIAALDATTPWPHELDASQRFIDTRSNNLSPDLRHAAYHLLWHARELSIDREPATKDRI